MDKIWRKRQTGICLEVENGLKGKESKKVHSKKKKKRKKKRKMIKMTIKIKWLFVIGWDGSRKNRQLAITWMALSIITLPIALSHCQSK